MFECDVIHILSHQKRQEGSIRFICIPSCVYKGAPPVEKQVRVMQPREEPEVVCWCWTTPEMWCREAWGWLCVLPLTAAEPGRLPHLSEPRRPHLSPDVHHLPGHFFCRLYVDPFISSLHMHMRTYMYTHANTVHHSPMCTYVETHTHEHRCAPLQPSESYPVEAPPLASLGLPISPQLPAHLNLNGSPTQDSLPFPCHVFYVSAFS